MTSTAKDEVRHRPRPDSERETDTQKKNPDAAKFHSWHDAPPHGLTVFVSLGAFPGNVRFDRLVKGGILVTDAVPRDSWSEVEFGEGNAGSGTELFTRSGGSQRISGIRDGRGATCAVACCFGCPHPERGPNHVTAN